MTEARVSIRCPVGPPIPGASAVMAECSRVFAGGALGVVAQCANARADLVPGLLQLAQRSTELVPGVAPDLDRVAVVRCADHVRAVAEAGGGGADEHDMTLEPVRRYRAVDHLRRGHVLPGIGQAIAHPGAPFRVDRDRDAADRDQILHRDMARQAESVSAGHRHLPHVGGGVVPDRSRIAGGDRPRATCAANASRSASPVNSICCSPQVS